MLNIWRKLMRYVEKSYLKKQRQQRITPFDITIFLRQFATLIAAGIPLLQSCDMLEKSQEKMPLRLLIYILKRDLLSGKNLFHSLRQHADYFDDFTCQLIQIGEHTGKLDQMLNIIAAHHENDFALQNRIKQALFYPCVILLLAGLITLGMLLFVIPRFADLFQDSHIPLPFITVCIFKLTAGLRQPLTWIAIVIVSSASVYLGKKYFRWLRSNIILFHPSLTKILLTRFARHLAICFAAGLPMPTALKLTAHSAGHRSIAPTIYALQKQINAGLPLHTAMATHSIFPGLMVQMIKIGEESGMLEVMLTKIADFYETATNQFIQRLSLLLEPLIMLVLGVLIGGLVIGMYLPLFKLGSAL